jgi:HTH-type transcriptional regulator, sugar sensing transcriptional regulator
MLNELKNIGLSDKEAKVYLAMLELGPATVLEIAAKAGVNRPTAYLEIESLKKRGLASTQTKGKKKLFIAESPSQLEFLIETQQKSLEQKGEELEKILPALTTLFNLAENKPQVRFFEGKEGLLTMQKELLKCKEKHIYAISSVDDTLKVFPNYENDSVPKRVHKKIRSTFIYSSVRGDFLKSTDKKNLRNSKFISPEKFKYSLDITIFDDNVAIASLSGDISGVIITNSEISKSFRAIFDLLWGSI